MYRDRFSGKTSFSCCLPRASIEGSGRMSAAHPYPKVVDRVSVPLSGYEVSGFVDVNDWRA